jgi:hypothetical protein
MPWWVAAPWAVWPWAVVPSSLFAPAFFGGWVSSMWDYFREIKCSLLTEKVVCPLSRASVLLFLLANSTPESSRTWCWYIVAPVLAPTATTFLVNYFQKKMAGKRPVCAWLRGKPTCIHGEAPCTALAPPRGPLEPSQVSSRGQACQVLVAQARAGAHASASESNSGASRKAVPVEWNQLATSPPQRGSTAAVSKPLYLRFARQGV